MSLEQTNGNRIFYHNHNMRDSNSIGGLNNYVSLQSIAAPLGAVIVCELAIMP